MSIAHEHNLIRPMPEKRPYGIRVRLKSSDPFRNLIGADWRREHWYPTREERDRALVQMKNRLYLRSSDQPTLEYEPIEQK
jgi:hypothetical protein